MTERLGMAAGGIGLLALIVLAFLAPRPAAQGWLIAFVFWSGIPIGSLVLLMIQKLTGGGWGGALAPALKPAAGVMPLVALGFLPILFAQAQLYPWAADPHAVPASVGRFYLNEGAFAARALVALGGWTALAVMVARGAATKLTAGLGLAFHGLVISLVAVDWMLSVEPHFTSTAFAAGIAVQQILAGLAWAALMSPEGATSGDLGALLIATLLGLVYIGFMSFIVSWYGDLPEQAAWYVSRGTPRWSTVILAAAVLGAGLPFALLLESSFRRNRLVLRLAGGLILFGAWLHVAWLLGPAFAPSSPLISLLALAALAGLSIGLQARLRAGLWGAHDR